MTDKPPFIQRMISEMNELRAKTNALEAFLEGEQIKALSEFEQALLNAQHAAMTTYEHVLGLRLAKYVEPASDRQERKSQ